ncbi:MAG: holo-[acyl-carrier-protein] synthase [bacterium]|nr:holo-[acyl-carrier-protein] synthase [bacterium]
MIYGTGIDIVHTDRIKKIICKHKAYFIERVFTDNEIKESNKHSDPTYYFAGRWAVKEAFSKALGTGIGASCSWLDVETLNEPSGAPKCVVYGNATKKLKTLNIINIHVSISHDKLYACANVILEK